MDNPVERALANVRSLAALAERLAKHDIVVRRLHCDWSAFGSWTVEASSGDGEAIIGTPASRVLRARSGWPRAEKGSR